MNDLQSVVEFRDRLESYIDLASEYAGRRAAPMSDDVRRQIATERSALTREYGRLMAVINRWGSSQIRVPAIGITSDDCVGDAINDVRGAFYGATAQGAIRHLDTVIGRLESEAEKERAPRQEDGIQPAPGRLDHDALYRVTSPLYWIERLVALLRWVAGTARGRIAAAVGAVLLVILGGIANGWAEAFFAHLMDGSSPTP